MTDVLLTSQLRGDIADHNDALGDALSDALGAAGFVVRTGSETGSSIRCVITSPEHFLTDEALRQQSVVLIAPAPSVREAVRCMQLGASDYLEPDTQADELIAAVERAVRASSDAKRTSAGISDHFTMVGDSDAMSQLREQIDKVAGTNSSVLILGESGTGKELIARALHSASQRRVRPLITLNCASVPNPMIEAELFGAVGDNGVENQGLVQAADGGTLFLDEIADLPMEAQARLLQVLESGQVRPVGSTSWRSVDVRVIAATHRALDTLTQNDQFRQDLYYRLSVISLVAPALRERGNDIIELANTFLSKTSERLDRAGLHFSQEAKSTMLAYRWPGNVRELSNAVERAVLLSRGEEIGVAELAIELPQSPPPEEAPASGDQTSLEDYFVKFVTEHQDQMTETELAERLGISRKSLWERRQRLNIPRKRTKKRGPRREPV